MKHFTIIGKSLGITLTITLFFFFQEKATAQFAKGADIGWLSQMEASGKKFYDKNGTQRDLLDILKMYNINAVRFRVWPSTFAGGTSVPGSNAARCLANILTWLSLSTP